MNAIQISNVAIRQISDTLYNLNDLHKAAGNKAEHQPNRWLRNQQTQDLIAEIEAEGGRAAEVVNGGKNRGTYVCKELVIAYGMWISPAFALKVIRCFLEAQGQVSDGLPAKTTADDRTPLRQAVAALVGRKGIDYSTAYGMIHQRFNVGAIEDIPAEKLPEAVAYVHALTLHTGLVGEVLDAEPAPAPFDDLDVAHLLLHAQDIRLFIRRYLPAFENLGIDKGGALWSYVHDTTPVFNRVRAAVLPRLKDQWLQRQIMKTAGV